MDFGFLQAHGSSPSSAASTTSAAPSSTAPCETCRSGRPARPSHVPQARRGTGGRRIHAGRREGVHEDPRRHLRDEANDPERQPPRCSPRTARGSSWLPTATNWRQLRKICIMELLSARRVRSFAAVREEEAARPAGPSRRLGCARDDDDDDDGSGTTPRPHQACRRVGYGDSSINTAMGDGGADEQGRSVVHGELQIVRQRPYVLVGSSLSRAAAAVTLPATALSGLETMSFTLVTVVDVRATALPKKTLGRGGHMRERRQPTP